MVSGCAEYRESDKDPYRIFINESTIKTMDASFQGRPVYVKHVDEVNLENLQAEADGYVVRSFYNAADGKTWAEFIVVSDRGHEAIRNGWRLSNAYIPKEFATGGLWNGIEYQKEITRGEYEHLAIVPNPRYDESVILTPEQFKEYNEKKELEIKRLSNSKQGDETVLSLFKKQKVENAADFENTMVTLPKSKVDKTLNQVVEMADTLQNMAGYAHPDHMVKMNDDEEMSVSKMVDSYGCMKSELEDLKKKKENVDLDGGEKQAEKDDAKADKTKKNDDEEKKENDEDEMDEKKKNAHFTALKNAHLAHSKDPVKADLDKMSRGKARYGSN